MNGFMNEIIDAILQFCKFFHLCQNVTHLLKQMMKNDNECRKTFKVMATKRNGIISSQLYSVISAGSK